MAAFGEVILESSRAFPDDEEDDGVSHDSALTPNGINLRITFEVNANAGADKILQELTTMGDISLYVFQGKVAYGFGNGFLSEEKFQFLGAIYYGGFSGIVDSLLSRPDRRPVVKLYSGPGRLVFALVDMYGLPRSLSNEVAKSISFIIEAAKNVVIFHSEASVAYRGEADVQGILFYLRSSAIQQDSSSIFKSVSILPQPNIVFGLSAAVLTHCEAAQKPGILLVTYCETELIDSISTRPFFDALEKGNAGSINIKGDFAKLTYNSSRSFKANYTPVRNSNLYT